MHPLQTKRNKVHFPLLLPTETSIRILRGRASPWSCVTSQKKPQISESKREHKQKHEPTAYCLLRLSGIGSFLFLAYKALYFYVQWQHVNHQRSPGSRMPNIQHHSLPTNKSFHHQAMQWDCPVQLKSHVFCSCHQQSICLTHKDHRIHQ